MRLEKMKRFGAANGLYHVNSRTWIKDKSGDTTMQTPSISAAGKE